MSTHYQGDELLSFTPFFKTVLIAIACLAIALLTCSVVWSIGHTSGIVRGHDLAQERVVAEVREKCIPWSTYNKERTLTGAILCKPLRFMGAAK
jgi:hypothetical protein